MLHTTKHVYGWDPAHASHPAVDVPTDHFHGVRPDLVRRPDGDDDLHGARFSTRGRRRYCCQRNGENQSSEGVRRLLRHDHRNCTIILILFPETATRLPSMMR